MNLRQNISHRTIICYTDGSCNVKTGLGGIGIYMKYGKNEKIVSKGFSSTKTGRMEIMAGIYCLRSIQNKNFRVIINSDSQYFVNSIEKGWVFNWEKDNFIDRCNSDIWKLFLIEYRKFIIGSVILRWVKGHNNTIGNELADQLASYKNFTYYEQDLQS